MPERYIMISRFRLLAIPVFTMLAVTYLACTAHYNSVKPTQAARKAGALDMILLGEHSDEIGQMVFPHYMHYGPKNMGLNGIACGKCHFCSGDARKDPIQSCRSCHFPHDESAGRRERSL